MRQRVIQKLKAEREEALARVAELERERDDYQPAMKFYQEGVETLGRLLLEERRKAGQDISQLRDILREVGLSL